LLFPPPDTHISRPVSPEARIRFILIGAVAVLGGCGGGTQPSQAPEPVPDPVSAPVAARAETVTVVRADPAMERELAQAQLRLLEQDALIENLQQMLDEAQREVVRSLAKLQTSATRAEAASAMAEAELAVQSLRRAAGQAGDLRRAERLMGESSAEFNKTNYGGALYLANQVKNVTSQRAPAGGEQLRQGETAFAVPVALETGSRANVRDGPGTNFRILFTLESGATLTGRSHVAGWIRVTDDQGRTGWISQGLVVRR
jgi:hypothetical protein